jgi:transglutaminase-like putative cysteine protease
VAICLAGVTLSIVMFVIFPRNVGRGLLTPRLASPVKTSRVEYTDEIDLTAGTRITESRRKVFELQLFDEGGAPVRLDGPLLLRGAALDVYDDGRWRASSAVRRRHVEIGPGRLATLSGEPVPDGERLRQVFRFRSGTETLFAMYLPAALGSEKPFVLAHDPATQTIRTTPPNPLVSKYTVESILRPTDEQAAAVSGHDDTRVDRRGFYRDSFEAGQPRVRELARSLLEEAGMSLAPTRGRNRWVWSVEAAALFAGYLQSEPFAYTLDLGGVIRKPGRDPVRSFLFDHQRGHCEYFASALAAMCHSMRIDARVVTGYVVYEYDEEAEHYIGLASNAHAWVEVRSGRHRWTPIDPTPPAVLEPTFTDEQPLGERLGWLYERIEDSWTTNVVEFDDRSQAEFLDRLDAGWSARLTRVLDDVREWMAGVNRAFHFGSWGYVWLGTVAAVVLLAMAALLTILRRIRELRRTMHVQRLRDAETRRLLRQLGFYLDMLVALRRHGLAKPAWQPPLAFAGAVADAQPDAAGLVAEITELYYAGRCGGRRLERSELQRARTMVERLEQTLKGLR